MYEDMVKHELIGVVCAVEPGRFWLLPLNLVDASMTRNFPYDSDQCEDSKAVPIAANAPIGLVTSSVLVIAVVTGCQPYDRKQLMPQYTALEVREFTTVLNSEPVLLM